MSGTPVGKMGGRNTIRRSGLEKQNHLLRRIWGLLKDVRELQGDRDRTTLGEDNQRGSGPSILLLEKRRLVKGARYRGGG